MAKAIKHRRASESEPESEAEAESESVTETPGQGSLCGACETRSTESTCSRCGTPLVLDGHWVLEKKLGEGGQSRVYEARSLRDGARAAVKVMSLDRARDWKSVEMFERSAKVLANLEHPGVPKFIASFRVEANAILLFCLVHERIDGETLKAALNRGERYDEAKARRLLREVLGILQYLHGFSPPVIHRDIKQSNLMRRKGGGLVLIDFDLVSDEAKPDGGSTIGVGTSGYAPIEQLMGEAVPATDLYALGMTLVTLLSRKDPSALRERGEHRVDFERHVHVSKDFEKLLGGMLEPEVARRFQTADAVLKSLEAKRSTSKPRRAQRDDAPAETESERPRIVPTAQANVRADIRQNVNRHILFIMVFTVVFSAAGFIVQWLASGLGDTESLPQPPQPTPIPTPIPIQAPASNTFAAEEDPSKVREALLGKRWSGELAGTQLSVVVNAKGDNLEATAAERDGTTRPMMTARINATGLVILAGDFAVLDVSHHLSCSGELATGGTSMRGTCADALTGKEGTAKTSTPFTLYTTQESTQ